MFDVGIIGAGPAGYTAAIRAAQYGLSVVIFEKQDFGGTCLNRGCIPTKALLHSAEVLSTLKQAGKFGINAENISFDYKKVFERKNEVVGKIRKSLTQLVKSYGIEIINANAVIRDNSKIEANDSIYECKNIIIASGSKPTKLTFEGNYDDSFLLNSDEILELDNLPKEILVVGSGAIGIEWTRILSEFGVQVTLIELANQLIPLADMDVSSRVERILKRKRVKFYTNTTITKIEEKIVTLSNGIVLSPEKILIATGRAALLGETTTHTKIETEKFIKTTNNFQTNIENIYAIGDVNGKSMLAHSAMHQAIEVIECIKNSNKCHFDSTKVPSVIYGHPEIAWVGKTEQQLIKENVEYKKSLFPIAALGKAYADDNIEGFIKILATEDQILGVHIISPEASALVQQILIAIESNTSLEDLSKIIFAHPTYSEGILEAILGLNNLAIHIPQTK